MAGGERQTLKNGGSRMLTLQRGRSWEVETPTTHPSNAGYFIW